MQIDSFQDHCPYDKSLLLSTPFMTISEEFWNWCKLTHFRAIAQMAKVDSFQDHHSGLYGKSSEIDSFQDPCELQWNWLISGPCLYAAQNPFVLTPFKTPVIYHQIDSFQDPMFICSTKLFKFTMLNLHGRLPPGCWFFQHHLYTVDFQTPSRPLHRII